jgi:DNA-binding transcriptional ArsR family regulator
MPKLTLDMNTFKALASDTRLDILRALDGKKMNLNDICKITNLNKATLHEHLAKLNEAGLIKKKEREGHKWVYYKLTWKGEGLLHPENTRIVVMFSTTFISLLISVMLIVNFMQPIPLGIANTVDDTTYLYEIEGEVIPLLGGIYNYSFLGSINAKEKTVGDITIELQNKAQPVNSIGDSYSNKDITWFVIVSASNLNMEDSNFLKLDTSRSLENFNILNDLKGIPIDDSQEILDYIIDSNNTYNNITNGTLNDYGEDNKTINQSSSEFENKSMYLGYYPLVPKMVATVHDKTYLYLAIACLTFFGLLLMISTWRLLVNRKQSL